MMTFALVLPLLAAPQDVPEIPAGGSVQAVVEEEGAAAWFRIHVENGHRYRIEASAGTLLDPLLELYAGDGTTLLESDDDGGDGLNAAITWTAPATGDYFIAVRASGDDETGWCTVSVRETSAATDDHGNEPRSATRVDVGATTPGEIEAPDDVDFFRFYAEEGQAYLLRVEHRGIGDTVLEVWNPQGTQKIAEDDDSGENRQPRLRWLAPATGYYFLKVRPFSGGTGQYAVIIETTESAADAVGEIPARAGTLAIGMPVEQSIDPADDRDMFAFEAAAGTTYTITVELVDLPDSVLELYATDGTTRLDRNDDAHGTLGMGSRIVFTPAEAGTYYAVVLGYRGRTGRYRITLAEGAPEEEPPDIVVEPPPEPAPAVPPAPVRRDDFPGELADAVRLPGGAPIPGEIYPPGDADWFCFDAQAARTYTITVRLESLRDSVLALFADDATTLLAENDDGEGDNLGHGSRIVWRADGPRRVLVRVGAFSRGQTGAYTVELLGDDADDHADDHTAGTLLAVDRAVPGVLSGPADMDCFRFVAPEAAMYTLGVRAGTASGATISLLGPDGTENAARLAENPTLVRWRAEEGAEYVVAVFGATGSYVVSVSPGAGTGAAGRDDHGNDAGTATPVEVGDIVDGTIESAGDEDWFAFEAEAGVAYVFEVQLNGLGDSTLALLDASGVQIEFNDDALGVGLASRIEWTAPEAGTYYLKVEGFGSGTGGYRLRLDRAP
jgi:hypothetical protein